MFFLIFLNKNKDKLFIFYLYFVYKKACIDGCKACDNNSTCTECSTDYRFTNENTCGKILYFIVYLFIFLCSNFKTNIHIIYSHFQNQLNAMIMLRIV